MTGWQPFLWRSQNLRSCERPFDESGNVLPELSQHPRIDVYHVTRLVVLEPDVRPLAPLQVHMVQRILRREVRSREVVIAASHKELQIRVLRKRAAQRLAGIGESVVDAPIPAPDPAAQ